MVVIFTFKIFDSSVTCLFRFTRSGTLCSLFREIPKGKIPHDYRGFSLSTLSLVSSIFLCSRQVWMPETSSLFPFLWSSSMLVSIMVQPHDLCIVASHLRRPHAIDIMHVLYSYTGHSHPVASQVSSTMLKISSKSVFSEISSTSSQKYGFTPDVSPTPIPTTAT